MNAWGSLGDGCRRFRISCSRCLGTRDDCARCSGTGLVWIEEKPSSYIGQRRDVWHFMDAYIQLHSRQILPQEGGWLDQSAAFVDAVRIADQERGRLESQESASGRDDRVRSEAAARTAKYQGAR